MRPSSFPELCVTAFPFAIFPNLPNLPFPPWRGTLPGRNVVGGTSWPHGLPMRDPSDAWLVRLPDGRVVRAKSTGSVRHHIETGRIPVDSWVRHSPEEDWTTLEWTAEFSDLAGRYRKRTAGTEEADPDPATLNREKTPRVNGNDLPTVGVRGLVEELLTALDSTLNGGKLLLAGTFSVLGAGVFLVFQQISEIWLDSWIPLLAAGVILMLIAAVNTAILTQMTFV